MDETDVILLTDGYWFQPDWSTDPADGERITTGWIVYQDDQHPRLFSHAQREVVEQWLREHGYRRVGRGTSFRRVAQGKQGAIPENAI